MANKDQQKTQQDLLHVQQKGPKAQPVTLQGALEQKKILANQPKPLHIEQLIQPHKPLSLPPIPPRRREPVFVDPPLSAKPQVGPRRFDWHQSEPVAEPRKFLPAVDRWFNEFIGPPKRARKVYGLLSAIGLLVGGAFGALTHASSLVPYLVVGALVGLALIELLRGVVKIVLAIVIVTLVGAAMALVLYAAYYFLR